MIRFFTRPYSSPPSLLLSQLQNDLKESLKSKEKIRSSVIKSVLSDWTYAQKSPNPHQISLGGLIRKGIKKRREAISEFIKAKRMDLAEKEEAEIGILDRFPVFFNFSISIPIPSLFTQLPSCSS